MKKMCRYVVLDLQTGYHLVSGQKLKDFENCSVRCVKSCTFHFIFTPWRKITEYFRVIEIAGRRCVIVYWVMNRVKKVRFYNTVFQRDFMPINLSGHFYSAHTDEFYMVYNRLLDILGIT